jgi:hypothetical protein
MSDFLESAILASPEMDATYQLASTVLARALRVPVAVNKHRVDSTTVILYVVDEERAAATPLSGGPFRDCLPVPIDQREVCERHAAVLGNCAVVSPHTIACDFQLLWRVSRYATMLAISSSKDSTSKTYPFPREEIRRTFNGGEAKYATTAARLENLRVTREAFQKGFAYVEPTRKRVHEGFLEFLLYHEAGHVSNGDVSKAALPKCALPRVTLDELCAEEDTLEVDADAFALDLMKADLDAATFTPARAAPEFFVEEYERRVYRAMLSIKKDPNTWTLESAPPDERAEFETAWAREVSTGSHPQDLRRYVRMMSALEKRGIKLTASLQSVQRATEALDTLASYCRKTIEEKPYGEWR